MFTNLNAAQALLAALIYRTVEERRKDDPAPADFLPYASHHLSMLVGRELLGDAGVSAADVSHGHFEQLAASLSSDGDRYYALAIESLTGALVDCYGEREVSLQQLAATFRRGDLLEMLPSNRPA